MRLLGREPNAGDYSLARLGLSWALATQEHPSKNLLSNACWLASPTTRRPDFRRPNRPELKKAGNLRYAFSRTSSEAIVIFDADFCPRADFLRETIPYLMDPKIGIIQTPQYFRWREEQTWIEQGAGVTQEFFYRLVQVGTPETTQALLHLLAKPQSTAVFPRCTLAPAVLVEDSHVWRVRPNRARSPRGFTMRRARDLAEQTQYHRCLQIRQCE